MTETVAPTAEATEARPAPVKAKDRFESLDVLRGLAVMGILMVNAPTFVYYWGVLEYPPAHMDATGANADAWRLMAVFFEMKFVTLFSALFGAGILLIAGETRESSTKLHYRRMLWLLAFGLIHGFVFWFGDILASYALVGMFAVMFRHMSVMKLLIFGILGILLTNALMVLGPLLANEAMYEPTTFGVVPDEQTLEMWVGAYQAGFLESRIYNGIGNLIVLLSNLITFGPRVLGVMLVGMALYKSGFLLARWSIVAYGAIAVVCLGVGLSSLWVVTGPIVESEFAIESMKGFDLLNPFASLIVALGYAALVMVVVKIGPLAFVRYPFAAMGRMAFTNYLTQTLTMVALATGVFAAPLFGVIERTDLVLLVLTIWAVQAVVSMLWLQVFRFGPFEWLWRSLSYGKFHSILKASA